MSNWTREHTEDNGQRKACVLCRINVPHERHIGPLEAEKLGIVVVDTAKPRTT